ncbi:hypothetical protein PICSAR65_03403 [Mycobacterium avium subsp. paratuberculosis]|nr:hypothetical protein PICSAR65_03403 [Mycobacterium avium subsp. paratuberculosis]
MASHSGNSRPHSPVRSSASMVVTVVGPADSSTSRSSSASRGQGSGISGAAAASRLSVAAPIGKPVLADAAATRSTRPTSVSGRASRASTISPAYSTTPSSRGRRLGRRTRADTPRRGSAFSAVRSPVSA